jgi:hypothetical protein
MEKMKINVRNVALSRKRHAALLTFVAPSPLPWKTLTLALDGANGILDKLAVVGDDDKAALGRDASDAALFRVAWHGCPPSLLQADYLTVFGDGESIAKVDIRAEKDDIRKFIGEEMRKTIDEFSSQSWQMISKIFEQNPEWARFKSYAWGHRLRFDQTLKFMTTLSIPQNGDLVDLGGAPYLAPLFQMAFGTRRLERNPIKLHHSRMPRSNSRIRSA